MKGTQLKSMYTFKIITLGCPLNQSESDSIAGVLKNYGFQKTVDAKSADLYVINSCTVTEKAARKSRKEAKKAKKENPAAFVCLMGCYGEMEREKIKNRIPEIDLVLGTRDRNELFEVLAKVGNCHSNQNIEGTKNLKNVERTFYTPDLSTNFAELGFADQPEKSRPVIKIQEGCDRACTYCIVTHARGKPKSRPVEHIMKQIERLLIQGYKEIILAGTNMMLYGTDTQERMDLPGLMEKIALLPYEFRLRLSSLEPMEIETDLLDVMAKYSKICNFLYLPLQSGSDKILSLMDRQYTTGEFSDLIQTAKHRMPDIGVITDLIVGFPGETHEDHQVTMDFIQELQLSKLHVFQFSPRPGTKAANFKNQIRPDIKKQRADALKKVNETLTYKFHCNNIDRILRVLIENNENRGSKHYLEGFSDNYCRAGTFLSDESTKTMDKGDFITVIGDQAKTWGILGKLCKL